MSSAHTAYPWPCFDEYYLSQLTVNSTYPIRPRTLFLSSSRLCDADRREESNRQATRARCSVDRQGDVANIAVLSAAAGVETRLATDDDCMQLRDNDVIVVHVR